MNKLFSSKRFKALLCIVAALLSGTIFAVVTSSNASPVTGALGVVLNPVQKAAAYVSEKLQDFNIMFQSSSRYAEKIEDLEKQIQDYEKQLVDYEQVKQKMNSYADMLEIKEKNPDYELEPATIIGRDSLDAFYSFIIDKGSSDGVSVNDPVVYGEYVVGLVHSVKATYSVVWTVFNPKVNISASEIRSREMGYTTTTSELAMEKKCLFSGLEKNTGVSVGSIVCTSGIGGIYPKGLIIGKISEIIDSKYDASVNAVIVPTVDITELENVFVITDFDEQGITAVDDE